MVKTPDFTDEVARSKVVKKVSSALVGTTSVAAGGDVAYMVHIEKCRKIVSIAESLLLHPGRIESTSTMANSDPSSMQTDTKRDCSDNTPWPEQYCEWSKIPNYCLWQWVRDNYQEFTWDVVEALQTSTSERGILRRLLQFAMGISDHMSVDSRLSSKLLMSLFLQEVAAARQHRLRGWVDRAFKDRKTVGWNDGGAMRLLEAEGVVTQICWCGDAPNQAVREPPITELAGQPMLNKTGCILFRSNPVPQESTLNIASAFGVHFGVCGSLVRLSSPTT